VRNIRLRGKEYVAGRYYNLVDVGGGFRRNLKLKLGVVQYEYETIADFIAHQRELGHDTQYVFYIIDIQDSLPSRLAVSIQRCG